MKNVSCLFLFLVLFSCSREKNEPCNREIACYEIFQPVCGSDGVTYSNDCYAEANCIYQYSEGYCPEVATGTLRKVLNNSDTCWVFETVSGTRFEMRDLPASLKQSEENKTLKLRRLTELATCREAADQPAEFQQEL